MKTRPAETGGVAGAVASLICYLAGVKDPVVWSAIGIVVGFVPAAITWCVETFKKPASSPGSSGVSGGS